MSPRSDPKLRHQGRRRAGDADHPEVSAWGTTGSVDAPSIEAVTAEGPDGQIVDYCYSWVTTRLLNSACTMPEDAGLTGVVGA